MSRRSFGRWINERLDEPDNEQFTDGKWRFWLPAVLGFSILNAALTVLIFRETDTTSYLTPIVLSASAIVGWIAIGCLHYSDAKRGKMARGVSALDSASLLFVIAHFCFLVYIIGHSWILKGAETKYAVEITAYNQQAGKMSEDNKAIADAVKSAAQAQKETARIEQDTAYQLRQAAKHGAKVQTQERRGSIADKLSTSPVSLAPPPKAPDDTHAGFLTRWDAWVRLTNFGELILAAVTLIFIRNWTAKSNAPRVVEEEFPAEIDTESRQPVKREKFSPKKEITKKHTSSNSAGLKPLREALKDISFRLKNRSFKASISGDAVWILMMKANRGTQETVSSAKASLTILDDALRMERTAFRERLEKFLRENGFEI